MTRRLLLVEDEREVAESMRALLEGEGYVVEVVGSLEDARRALRAGFDVVLLDRRLPDGEGIELFRELRRTSNVPVLMVTARVDVIDRVLGLELGADDYVTKPFEPRELLARIKARLRNAGREHAAPAPRVLAHAGIAIDLDARAVTFHGEAVTLTRMELDLLALLVEHPGRVFSREELLNRVWGFERTPTTRTVDTHVAELRRKLERDPANPKHILTVRKTGYRLAR
jgi:DNA-binding response OmpR family regulator